MYIFVVTIKFVDALLLGLFKLFWYTVMLIKALEYTMINTDSKFITYAYMHIIYLSWPSPAVNIRCLTYDWIHNNPPTRLTIDARHLDTGCRREKSFSMLTPCHARALHYSGAVVVVEWVLAGRVGSVHRHALEAIDRPWHCAVIQRTEPFTYEYII